MTAYCPCSRCCGSWSKLDAFGDYANVTASGLCVNDPALVAGFVAAPKDVAFGTRIIIPGYSGGNSVPVVDRGGAIQRQDGLLKLDVYFKTHEAALDWGWQMLDVEVLDKEREN